MSQTYQDSAAVIHQRIVTLRQQERTQEDPDRRSGFASGLTS